MNVWGNIVIGHSKPGLLARLELYGKSYFTTAGSQIQYVETQHIGGGSPNITEVWQSFVQTVDATPTNIFIYPPGLSLTLQTSYLIRAEVSGICTQINGDCLVVGDSVHTVIYGAVQRTGGGTLILTAEAEVPGSGITPCTSADHCTTFYASQNIAWVADFTLVANSPRVRVTGAAGAGGLPNMNWHATIYIQRIGL